MGELFEGSEKELHECFTEYIEEALDAADKMAEETTIRYTQEEVRRMRLEHSKQWCEKDLYSLLEQGYKAMQEGRETSIDEVKEKIRKRRE